MRAEDLVKSQCAPARARKADSVEPAAEAASEEPLPHTTPFTDAILFLRNGGGRARIKIEPPPRDRWCICPTPALKVQPRAGATNTGRGVSVSGCPVRHFLHILGLVGGPHAPALCTDNDSFGSFQLGERGSRSRDFCTHPSGNFLRAPVATEVLIQEVADPIRDTTLCRKAGPSLGGCRFPGARRPWHPQRDSMSPASPSG